MVNHLESQLWMVKSYYSSLRSMFHPFHTSSLLPVVQALRERHLWDASMECRWNAVAVRRRAAVPAFSPCGQNATKCQVQRVQSSDVSLQGDSIGLSFCNSIYVPHLPSPATANLLDLRLPVSVCLAATVPKHRMFQNISDRPLE